MRIEIKDDAIYSADTIELSTIDGRDSGRCFRIHVFNASYDDELIEVSQNTLQKIRDAITKLIEHY